MRLRARERVLLREGRARRHLGARRGGRRRVPQLRLAVAQVTLPLQYGEHTAPVLLLLLLAPGSARGGGDGRGGGGDGDGVQKRECRLLPEHRFQLRERVLLAHRRFLAAVRPPARAGAVGRRHALLLHQTLPVSGPSRSGTRRRSCSCGCDFRFRHVLLRGLRRLCERHACRTARDRRTRRARGGASGGNSDRKGSGDCEHLRLRRLRLLEREERRDARDGLVEQLAQGALVGAVALCGQRGAHAFAVARELVERGVHSVEAPAHLRDMHLELRVRLLQLIQIQVLCARMRVVVD